MNTNAILCILATLFAFSSASAEELKSKKLKLDVCNSVAHDYYDYDEDVDEDVCYEGSFNVLEKLYSPELKSYVKLKVKYTSEIAGENETCIVELNKKVYLDGAKIKTYWFADTLSCKAPKSANVFLAQLEKAISKSDNLWVNGVGLGPIKEASPEEELQSFIKDQKDFIAEKKADGDKDIEEEAILEHKKDGLLGDISSSWLLGECSTCVDFLKNLENSGEIYASALTSNGQDEDYVTYEILILLKNGQALNIYFGN